MKKNLLVAVLLSCAVIASGLLAGSAVAQEKKPCIACHEKVSPGIVAQFKSSTMFTKAGMDCSGCHGSDHQSAADAKKAKLPSPDTCAPCHPDRVKQFREGKHSLAWVSMNAMPMISHQPKAVTGNEGLKGCSGCHKMGDKDPKDMVRYGTGGCDACHTRHSFSAAEAKDPRACRTCHMGFDHPHWEMWQTSKHGTIWEREPNSGRAPTCQTCHMPDGNHGVMTAWGFLALRLPEEDKAWLNDRVTILQALGVLDSKGNPTARLDAVKAAKIARLDKETFEAQKNKMLDICTKCHSRSYANEQYLASEHIIKEVDKIFADSIRTVKALYDDGILKKPAGWDFAPDLLQFYDAKSVAEQELHLIFMEYRMRAFQGAFHSNPDYMHWYGWAKVKEAAVRIKEDAARLRAEHAAATPAKAPAKPAPKKK